MLIKLFCANGVLRHFCFHCPSDLVQRSEVHILHATTYTPCISLGEIRLRRGGNRTFSPHVLCGAPSPLSAFLWFVSPPCARLLEYISSLWRGVEGAFMFCGLENPFLGPSGGLLALRHSSASKRRVCRARLRGLRRPTTDRRTGDAEGSHSSTNPTIQDVPQAPAAKLIAFPTFCQGPAHQI
jgi:hypothetical protein